MLETNTDDWPFLVDSRERGARARAASSVVRLVHPIIGDLARGRADRRASRTPRNAIHRESVMHFDLARG